MEEAYREHGEEIAPDHARERLSVPLDERQYWFNNVTGAVPGTEVMALRIASSQSQKQEDRNVFIGDDTGLVLLFDIQSTNLLSITDAHYLSPIRVAATSAVAVQNREELSLADRSSVPWGSRVYLLFEECVRREYAVCVSRPTLDRAHRLDTSPGIRLSPELGNTEP